MAYLGPQTPVFRGILAPHHRKGDHFPQRALDRDSGLGGVYGPPHLLPESRFGFQHEAVTPDPRIHLEKRVVRSRKEGNDAVAFFPPFAAIEAVATFQRAIM